MNIVRGIAFPDADRFMVTELAPNGTYQLDHLEAALRHVTSWTCAIDGGAHVGTWARVMGGRFAHVLAIEPSPDTFECLCYNLAQAGESVWRFECLNAALGATPGFVSMALDADNAARANTGARFVTSGGQIPVITIDSLDLESCGFLKLDVEGSEPMALMGAEQTIRRCHPVVLYEAKRLWTRHFGLPKNAVTTILESFGYRMVDKVSADEIWIHGGGQ